jgi:hypothetical protein
MIEVGDSKRYFVHLGRQLLVGEEAIVRIREQYSESSRDPRSIHSYYVNHGLKELNLVLEYPADRVPTAIVWREYMGDPESGDVLDGGQIAVDSGGGQAQFQRHEPQEGRSLAIEWTEPAVTDTGLLSE